MLILCEEFEKRDLEANEPDQTGAWLIRHDSSAESSETAPNLLASHRSAQHSALHFYRVKMSTVAKVSYALAS